MNDTEVLTEAARLLRERAAAAPPGRWYSQGVDPRMGAGFRRYEVETAARIPGARILLRPSQSFSHWDVGHVAGLDPDVAVKLAELFETEAQKTETFGHPAWDDGHRPRIGGPDLRVVAVARTYLRDLV